MQLFHGAYDTLFRLIPTLRGEVRETSAENSRLSRALAAREEEVQMLRADTSSRGDPNHAAREIANLSKTLAARNAEIRGLRRQSNSRMERIRDLEAEVSRLKRERGSREQEIASAVTWELAQLQGQQHPLSSRVIYREAPPREVPPVYREGREEVVCSIPNVKRWRQELQELSAKVDDLRKTIVSKDDLARRTARMHTESSKTIDGCLQRVKIAESLRETAEAKVADLEGQLKSRGEEAVEEFRQGSDFRGLLINAGTDAVRTFVSGILDSLPAQAALLVQLSEEFVQANTVHEGPVSGEDPVSPTNLQVEGSTVDEESADVTADDPVLLS